MIRTGFGRLLIALALAGVVGLIGLPVAPPASAATGIVRLMAAGDVMLGRTIGQRILSKGTQWPFYRVAATFGAADLVVVNLECAITDRGTRADKRYAFRGPDPEAAAALVRGGIDVVSQANNHVLDWGVVGLHDTVRLLDARGIGHAGAGDNSAAARAPYVVTVNGLRIAFLSYVKPMWESTTDFTTLMWEATSTRPGVAIARKNAVAADVARAKTTADVVIVYFHFGREYRTSPGSGQIELAQAAIGAGASLVLGAHPHVLQGYVARNHTLIAYSLGNFVFDGFSGASNDSVILDVTLSAAGVDSFRWIPVVIVNGRPRPAIGDEIQRILNRIPNLS
jgi:poly-gamma-glutamate capsule biosynthesis protein CapA/YwtB (metallophosphatase superfamily)